MKHIRTKMHHFMIISFFARTSLRYVRVVAIPNPSVVCNVRAPAQVVEIFGNISSPFCTLAIL